MNAVWAICRRDVVAAFTSPMAWLVLACWTLLVDAVFMLNISSLHDVREGSAADPLYVGALSWGVVFLMLLAPAVTMASFSAERVQGTMQLLLTVPVREHELVLGKFLAAFLVLASLVAATLVQPLTLLFISGLHGSQLAAGYAGLLLCCALFAALGVWVSLLVDTPVAAYVITFGAIAVLIILGIMGDDSALSPLSRALGVTRRAWPFLSGEVELGNVAYFVCGSGICLVMAHGALCARRITG